MNEFIDLHIENTTATLLLCRPPTNTTNRQMFREITSVARHLCTYSDLTAVIIFGGHEIFSAGADREEFTHLEEHEKITFTQARARAIRAIASINKPTVAAITGYALGCGLALALAADWRISGDNAKFNTHDPQLDLLPDPISVDHLNDAVGTAYARELVFTGQFFDAPQALHLGLITTMVAPDDVYSAAQRWASQMKTRSPQWLNQAKALLS